LYNANEGFIHYKPELENRIAVERPLVINRVYSVAQDSILYNRKPFEVNVKNLEELVVSNKAKVLRFEIESFQFKKVNSQQFRYFLKGFDSNYGDWTNASFKEYSNLTEGNYEFKVQTRDYLGGILNSPPLNLIVKPPFYRSLLAKILYAILGMLTIYFISRYYNSLLKRKVKEKEEAKQLELVMKQRELIEIQEQKEKELLHRKGNIKETKQGLELIVKEIDITLRLQEDWEQFEHHFDQVHGDFLSRLRNEFLDLSPNEQKLCAFLRLNLNTKDMANLMGISQRGVEVARYRLRKKLALGKGQNLTKFILNY